MLDSKKVMRIRAYAQVFNVDLNDLDDTRLMEIIRLANANEWALLEDAIKAGK